MSNGLILFECAYGKVYKYSNEDNYYYERESDGVEFDIGKNWLSNTKGKAVTNQTKSNIIGIAKHKSLRNEGIKRFIEWYDKLSQTDINVDVPINPFTNVSMNANVSPSNNTNALDSNNVFNLMLEEMRKQTLAMENQDQLDRIMEKKTEQIAKKLSDIVDDYIHKEYGNIPKHIEIQTPKATVQIDGNIHKDFQPILQLINLKIPTLLVGPAGCGKNFILEKCAESLGLDFYFTNAVTQEYKLTGFIDANGVYQETQFYKAFKNGGIFFLDEMDASIPEALIILNAAIANGYFDFPNEKVSAHPDFRVVAAANTYGYGADMMYVGRSQLDAATLDRFIVFSMDYDEVLERTKCQDNQLFEFISEFRRVVNKSHLRFTVSTRMMINSYKMLSNGIDKRMILKVAILKGMTQDDIELVKNNMSIPNNEWYRLLNQ